MWTVEPQAHTRTHTAQSTTNIFDKVMADGISLCSECDIHNTLARYAIRFTFHILHCMNACECRKTSSENFLDTYYDGKYN